MRLYGIIESDSEDNSYITDISSNIDTFEKSDNVYYTDREHADTFDVYDPFEENWDACWLPYNCRIIEYDIYIIKMENITMRGMNLKKLYVVHYIIYIKKVN